MTLSKKIISQGAEAIIYKERDYIIKSRVPKSYRLKILDDKIRKQRTKAEKKLLEKASKIINTPKPMHDSNIYQISMPFIYGEKLSENLDKFHLEKQKEICRKIGESIAKLHHAEIIHGDLTTSNIILVEDKIFLIDFGLGFISQKPEDKAIDLHLLKQALEAKHFMHWEILFKEITNGYLLINSENAKKVLERLKAVEKRGRYKEKY